jgi:hypothetical protein
MRTFIPANGSILSAPSVSPIEQLVGTDPDQERRALYRFVRAWGRRKP